MRYRTEGASAAAELVVIELAEEAAVLVADAEVLVYRRGPLVWSRASASPAWWLGLATVVRRRAVAGVMDRYDGPGEVGLCGPQGGPVHALELGAEDNWVVAQRCLLAVTPGVAVDVALRRGDGTTMLRVVGEGIAFIQGGSRGLDVDLGDEEVLDAPLASIVCFEATVGLEVEVRRSRSSWWGAASAEVAALRGPGRVSLQAAAALRPGR